jgi:CTP:molybdopterin cytidylyltransferase MocA
LTRLHDRPLLAYALAAAHDGGCAPVVLVVSDARVAAAAGEIVTGGSVDVVRNDAPERGIASSLQCALRHLEPRASVPAVVVGLADQPLVGGDAYRRLVASFAAGARLAYATYAGVRGNPVLIAREHWADAMTLTGDEGARVLFRNHPAVAVPCDDTGAATDVDTRQDLADLESRVPDPEE